MIRDPTSPRWLLFSFDGRIGRRTWWLWSAAAMIGLATYFTVAFRVAGASASSTDLLVNALLLWPALALGAKRWHDLGKSGWWALLVFVPVVGWLAVLVANGLVRGTPGVNRFGEAPATLR
jgi:uncharacterized membrane protein YhaH (DUF805 family)